MPREQSELQVRVLNRAGCTEIFASAAARPTAATEFVLERLAQVVARGGAKVAALDVYGLPISDELRAKPLSCLGLWQRPPASDVIGGTPVPQPLVPKQSAPLQARQQPLPHGAGAQVWAIAGAEVNTVLLDGREVGAGFADCQARYVRLGGILAADMQAPPGVQARQVLEQMDAVLRTCQMGFQNVARTWFYNRDVLAWYDEFNAVRNAFFAERRLDWQRLPASTGVGFQPVSNAALTGGLLAVAPLRPDSDMRVAVVASPRQGPAPGYGSAFSRAVEIITSDHRRLLISGTASIDQEGRTLHPGDIRRQIAETFEVVRRLLESRDMSWADVMRGVAYFRRVEDIAGLAEHVARQGLPAIHILPVVATICRDELLFELELDAAVVAQGA
jgi:enamine deaminase RidA (YjgF/YER057c/UK114 family)